jgi:hypothetical protein
LLISFYSIFKPPFVTDTAALFKGEFGVLIMGMKFYLYLSSLIFFYTKTNVMENSNQDRDMNRNSGQDSPMGNQTSGTQSWEAGSNQDSMGNRSSDALGGQSQGMSDDSQNSQGGNTRRSGTPGSSGYDSDVQLEGGDSGRGGSTGTGNTARSGDEDNDMPGAAGM